MSQSPTLFSSVQLPLGVKAEHTNEGVMFYLLAGVRTVWKGT